MPFLVMLTKHFPYGTGEEFIENEISHLSNAFERILVIACQAQKGEIITRTLPTCVDSVRIDEISSRLGKLIFAIKGLLKITDNEVRGELHRAHTLKAKAAVVYYSGKMAYIYPRILSAVKSSGIPETASVAFYSYWLFDTADAACRLRDAHLFRGKCCAVSRGHGFDVYAERNICGYLPFQQSVIKRLNAAYICSEDGRRRLTSLYPKEYAKIKVSYLGTRDCGLGSASTDGIFRIVTCSWLAPLKRTGILAKALKIIMLKYPGEVQWTCIGSGELMESYKEYAATELTDVQVIFKGALSNKSVMDYYSSEPVDLFVSTSESEGLPVSIMEAQSFGIPSLATDAGGTREITITGETGTLIPVEITPEQLTEQICKRLEMSQAERDNERLRCRKFWFDNFDANKNYINFSDEILKLLIEGERIYGMDILYKRY